MGATLVSLLMMKNVFIARSFNREQRQLVQDQQMADAAPQYETAWKTLAMHIYEKSKTDPALAELLKNADVQVRAEETPAPGTESTPAPGTPGLPPVPGKSPATL